jgi:hypothetical protein
MLKYKISIENGINNSIPIFSSEIYYVLGDKRSWPFDFVQDQREFDFQIILTKPETIKNICGLKGNLSCTDMNTNIVYINNYRWTKGSQNSKLKLDEYRIYLINHEVGHVLGLDHSYPHRGQKCPVMVQQTKGVGDSIKNVWPLHEEKIQSLLLSN